MKLQELVIRLAIIPITLLVLVILPILLAADWLEGMRAKHFLRDKYKSATGQN